MRRLPVKDENLRLVLSKDHGKWLDREIRDRRIAIIILLTLMTVGSLSLYDYLDGYLADKADGQTETSVVYMDHDATHAEKQSLSDQGFTVVLKNPDGSVPGAQPQVGETDVLTGVFKIISIILLIVSPFLVFFVGKAVIELATLHKWKKEHATFLENYLRPLS